jgi:hypothetical protein
MLSPVLVSRFGQVPVDPAERIAWLTAKCRSMRAMALAARWSYDLALHSSLLTVLGPELAALAADGTSLASPDQRDVRAAA